MAIKLAGVIMALAAELAIARKMEVA